MDPTIEELAKTYSLSPFEVKKLRGAALADRADLPIVSEKQGDVVRIADDWRFAKWLAHIREPLWRSTPNKGEL